MKQILIIMAALFCSTVGKAAVYPSDVIETADGGKLKITFFAHGSLAFEYMGRHIYIDPVGDYADYASLPKADMILVTHEHGDHLDPVAIKTLSNRKTQIFGNGTAIEALGKGKTLMHGNDYFFADVIDRQTVQIVKVDAVPAYNFSPEKLNFHPRDRKHNGYILDFGGTLVYVAGDTEDTPEVMALGGKNIDIAFLPVNLPYTMTEEQAARAVKAIRPKIFYPYHYGQVEHKTDLAKLEKLLENSGIEVKIRPME